jgi:beta-lactamase superfamily II metal-dependent hydrolase
LLPGDAHDKTWDYVLDHYTDDVKNCSVLIAPHHGRGSGRDYTFLDVMRPKLTLFGCAPSEHLDYNAWNNRNLLKITSNQAGNVVFECENDNIDVFVENSSFATKFNPATNRRNAQGYWFIMSIPADD